MSEPGRSSCETDAMVSGISALGVDIKGEQRLILRNALLATLLCMAVIAGAC